MDNYLSLHIPKCRNESFISKYPFKVCALLKVKGIQDFWRRKKSIRFKDSVWCTIFILWKQNLSPNLSKLAPADFIWRTLFSEHKETVSKMNGFQSFFFLVFWKFLMFETPIRDLCFTVVSSGRSSFGIGAEFHFNIFQFFFV